MVKNPPANAGDMTHGFDPWAGKIPGRGHGNPLQYSCLENPMEKVAWWATVHGVAESRRTQQSNLADTHLCDYKYILKYVMTG